MTMPSTLSLHPHHRRCPGAVRGFAAAPAQEREVPPSREALQYSFAPIVKKAAPAVVNVYVRARVQTFVSPFANDPLFRRFFGEAASACRRSASRTRWARA